mmetsp:Transcript_25134/g.72672  ORF Transcript_25134/g.72672 Transcript_25134/m.72672 type:complete len:211 (-) Transcript_25134:4869-5501(-)
MLPPTNVSSGWRRLRGQPLPPNGGSEMPRRRSITLGMRGMPSRHQREIFPSAPRRLLLQNRRRGKTAMIPSTRRRDPWRRDFNNWRWRPAEVCLGGPPSVTRQVLPARRHRALILTGQAKALLVCSPGPPRLPNRPLPLPTTTERVQTLRAIRPPPRHRIWIEKNLQWTLRMIPERVSRRMVTSTQLAKIRPPRHRPMFPRRSRRNCKVS